MRKIFVRDVKAKFCPTLGNKYRQKICLSCREKERHYTISMCDILLSHFSLAQFSLMTKWETFSLKRTCSS